ncbi:MAG: NAD-dependent epimerase/dehydratase family protein [Marinibacterium sp.]
MARILVTGAGGFLGRYAVEALIAAGWQVVASGRRAPDLPGLTDAVAADLLDPADAAALVDRAGADVLLHLAWTDDPRARWHSPDNLDWVAATLALARRFADAGGRRIVFGSSCAVYDFAAGPVHAEADRTAPASLYGAAKAATGSLLGAAQSALGITVAEARMFFCYGGGEPAGRLIPDLVAGLSRGEPVACTDGRQARDYLHGADIGRALALLAGTEITGAVNVASGTATPVADLIGELARQMGRPDLPQMGAIQRAANDPDEITGDVSRLHGLGFRPELDLAAGVAETLARDLGGAGA